jgi:hypothetical protein
VHFVGLGVFSSCSLHRSVPGNLQMTKQGEVIAEDDWLIGTERVARRVYVLKPEAVPGDKNGDSSRVSFAIGVGPVDALMNTSRVLISIWDEVGGAAPRAAPKKRRR